MAGITLKLEGEGNVLWAEEGTVSTEGSEKTAYKNQEQYVNKISTILEADELQPGQTFYIIINYMSLKSDLIFLNHIPRKPVNQ